MSSIHTRKKSKQLQMSIVLPDGHRVAKSLSTTDGALANAVGVASQNLVDALSGPQKARQSVLKVLVEDIFIAAQVPNPWEAQEALVPVQNFVSFANEYITRKNVTKKTVEFLKFATLDFVSHTANYSLDVFNGTMCQQWYDSISKTVSANTANNRLQAVSGIFKQAVKLGLINRNPCDGLQVKDGEQSVKEELTDEEVEKVLAHLDFVSIFPLGEAHCQRRKSWKMAVLLARYAGCRLGDAVNMTFDNVKEVGGNVILAFTPSKTGAPLEVPVMGKLLTALRSIDSHQVDICPSLKGNSIERLSIEFGGILDQAGVDTGKYEQNGQTRRKKTFHSLRHSFISHLMRMGVPEEIRMAVSGHSSRVAHKGYVHRSGADLAKAMKEFIPTS